MDKKIWISSIIAFILGFFVAWLIFRSPVPATAPESLAEGDEAATSSEDGVIGDKKVPAEKSSPAVSRGVSGEGTLTIRDQEFGDSVSLSSVTLGAAGWVAIHEDKGGGLGNILGAAWFPEGTNEDVKVELLRATAPGTLYHAVLHSDDGDREFAHTKDAPFEDAEGKILETAFRTLSLDVE
ncbi:MAG: hypothetical protein AAB634_00430 [Patescibacteria group bacterium]